ncbi:hypothetical protein H4R34_003229 [Dimargaris verticillata]|uniref:Transcription factor domain-containing protein n=1 Tax=Dimargaris verticillata TaxID=2761393 RepID=A0A9W8B0D7_9FUNG|nr:hypothetical protein H4R34_003229 [Dimargaris verticillata]
MLLMKQQGYHQVDLAIPSPMAAPVNSQTTLVPADDNYLREYKRRAFWETYILGAMYYSQIGKPYPFSAEDICVRPVNDHLIHHILTMDPDRDNYPVVLPGIRHMMCGYKPLIAFFHLASKVANLRGQAWQKSLNPATTYASGSAIPAHVLATYHDLNHHLQVWYAELPDSLALSDYANLDKDKVKKHPVHHSYLYTIHAGFHHTILLLNLHNWTLGTPDATPGLYVPERDRRCHEWALASAHAYTRQCFPLIQRLPPMVCNVCIAGHTFACALKYVLYLKHFWYYHTLTSDSASGQNAQGDNHDLDTGTRLEPGSAFTRTLASPSPLPTTMASFATPITHEAAYRERQWLRATANDYIKFLDHLRLYFLYARAFRDILQTHLDACPQ